MIGILNSNKTRVIFGPKEISIKTPGEGKNVIKSVYLEVDGHTFLEARTESLDIFKELEEKFSEILENYLNTFAKYGERNYVFDLSFYNEEINKIVSKE